MAARQKGGVDVAAGGAHELVGDRDEGAAPESRGRARRSRPMRRRIVCQSSTVPRRRDLRDAAESRTSSRRSRASRRRAGRSGSRRAVDVGAGREVALERGGAAAVTDLGGEARAAGISARAAWPTGAVSVGTPVVVMLSALAALMADEAGLRSVSAWSRTCWATPLRDGEPDRIRRQALRRPVLREGEGRRRRAEECVGP